MKNRWLTIGFFLLILSFGLTACKKEKVPVGETVKLYFFNNTEGKLIAEPIPIKIEPDSPKELVLEQVISALYKGSSVPTAQLVIPKDMEIALKDKILMITFSDSYNSLTAQEQIILRTCLVLSLTELDFIEGVEFFIGNNPLKNSNGEKIGPLRKNDILISAIDPKPATSTQSITLYFTKANEQVLYPEKRAIQVNNNVPLEKYVLEELIKGPRTEGLLATVPSNTTINDVKTQDGVCQVDISYDFKSKQYATPQGERLMIYSIVNALTGMPNTNIQKVTFLIDGKKQTNITAAIDFSTLFERDESIVAKDE